MTCSSSAPPPVIGEEAESEPAPPLVDLAIDDAGPLASVVGPLGAVDGLAEAVEPIGGARPPVLRPTGRDVARLAGVSQATVSLVLSQPKAGQQRVSESTQERVRAAARLLGYRPHSSGRHLRLGRTGLILLAVPDLRAPFSRVLAGAHEAAEARDQTVVVCSDWTGETLARTMTANQFDGLVVCSTANRQTIDADTAFAAGAPTVFLDADPALASATRPMVLLDLVGGMRSAVEHLADLGHKRIGHLRYRRDSHTFRARDRAFDGECRSRDLETAEFLITGEGLEAVTAAARVLLDRPDHPEAVVCDDDVAAVGVYHAAARLGLRIPDDVCVVGIDNIDAAALLNPGLTTVDLRGEDLGGLGLATMAALLGRQPGPALTAVRTELIVRGSTRRA